jgi:hypothetical protein
VPPPPPGRGRADCQLQHALDFEFGLSRVYKAYCVKLSSFKQKSVNYKQQNLQSRCNTRVTSSRITKLNKPTQTSVKAVISVHHAIRIRWLYRIFLFSLRLYLHSRDAQFFQKFRSHLKILGVGWVIKRKFHTENPAVSGAIIQNFVALLLYSLTATYFGY